MIEVNRHFSYFVRNFNSILQFPLKKFLHFIFIFQFLRRWNITVKYILFRVRASILSMTTSCRLRFVLYLFRSSNGIVPMVVRKIKIKVLRRHSTIGAQHAMCQHSVVDVSRFNTEYNRVNSKTNAAKIKPWC